jgi:hypothetical protein
VIVFFGACLTPFLFLEISPKTLLLHTSVPMPQPEAVMLNIPVTMFQSSLTLLLTAPAMLHVPEAMLVVLLSLFQRWEAMFHSS